MKYTRKIEFSIELCEGKRTKKEKKKEKTI